MEVGSHQTETEPGVPIFNWQSALLLGHECPVLVVKYFPQDSWSGKEPAIYIHALSLTKKKKRKRSSEEGIKKADRYVSYIKNKVMHFCIV